MIINSKKDLDKSSKVERERFLKNLAVSVKRWRWQDGEWQLTEHTKPLERFGLTLDDLPAVDDPPKPDYNPEERERKQLAEEIRAERDRKLRATDFAVYADSPHDTDEVREYRQALRDVPQQEGFPEDITWPSKPDLPQ